MTNFRSNPESLSQWLDTDLPPGRDEILSQHSDDPFVQTAVQVAQADFPALSDDALQRIEFLILGTYDHQRRRSARRRVTVGAWAAACILVLMLIGALLPSVRGSVPGDALYAVKRTYEQIESGLAVSSSARLDVYLRQLDRRVNEVQTLASRDQFDLTLFSGAITGLERTLTEAPGEAQQSRLLAVSLNLQNTLLQAQTDGLVSMAAAETLNGQILAIQAQLQPPDMSPSPSLPPVTSTPTPSSTPTLTPTPTAMPSLTPTLSPRHTVTPLPTARIRQQEGQVQPVPSVVPIRVTITPPVRPVITRPAPTAQPRIPPTVTRPVPSVSPPPAADGPPREAPPRPPENPPPGPPQEPGPPPGRPGRPG